VASRWRVAHTSPILLECRGKIKKVLGVPHTSAGIPGASLRSLCACVGTYPLYLSSVLKAEDHAGRVAQPTLSCAKCLSRVPCPSSAWAGVLSWMTPPELFLVNEFPLDVITELKQCLTVAGKTGVSTSVLISRFPAAHRYRLSLPNKAQQHVFLIHQFGLNHLDSFTCLDGVYLSNVGSRNAILRAREIAVYSIIRTIPLLNRSKST
jgi:hypothetical protein